MKFISLLLALLMSVGNAYAAPQRALLIDSSEQAFGTQANPIRVAGTVFSSTVWTDPINDYNCAGVITTTTGNITSGSNQLTVASASGWSAGMGITVVGGGVASANLNTTISSISETTFTLASNASTTVSGGTIKHDDTTCLTNAIDSGKNIHLRAGNYRIRGLLTMNNVTQIIEGDGIVPRGATSDGLTGTLIVNAAAASTGAIKMTSGYTQLKNLSIDVESGITAGAAVYGVEVLTSGQTTDRQYTIDGVLIYGHCGGLKISDAASFSYFNNVIIGVCNGSTEAGLYLDNSSPAGDNRFNNMDIRIVLGGTTASKGIYIAAADVNQWSNIKVVGAFTTGMLIDGASGATFNQKFVSSSFENATTDCVKINSSGNAITNVSFVGSEIGTTCLDNVEIAGSAVKNVSLVGNNLIGGNNGVNITATGTGYVVLGNNFKDQVTSAITVSSATPTDITIGGNTFSNTGSRVVNSSGNTNILRLDGGTNGSGISIGTTSNPINKLNILGSVGIGTTGATAYTTTLAPAGGMILSGNVGIGSTIPNQNLMVNGGAGFGSIKADGDSGGCIMLQDTDNAGWTECKVLDGVMTCATDADGVCD